MRREAGERVLKTLPLFYACAANWKNVLLIEIQKLEKRPTVLGSDDHLIWPSSIFHMGLSADNALCPVRNSQLHLGREIRARKPHVVVKIMEVPRQRLTPALKGQGSQVRGGQ